MRTFDTPSRNSSFASRICNSLRRNLARRPHGYRTPAQVRAENASLIRRYGRSTKLAALNKLSQCLKTGPRYTLLIAFSLFCFGAAVWRHFHPGPPPASPSVKVMPWPALLVVNAVLSMIAVGPCRTLADAVIKLRLACRA